LILWLSAERKCTRTQSTSNAARKVQGNILLYAAFIKSAPATVTEAKGTVLLPLNVFKYPPGKEPNKTAADDKGGYKTLPEKEDNPASLKVSTIRHIF
jgi:hypothetical protein